MKTMTNEWMYGYTLFRQSPSSPRLSVSVFRPGEVELLNHPLQPWPDGQKIPLRWLTSYNILQHLTTSYNILQHLKSNLEVTISSEMHLESQLNFWGAGPPGPVVWRSLVCGGARRISWEWWRFFGMTQTSQWNSQWKILNIGISSVYMH